MHSLVNELVVWPASRDIHSIFFFSSGYADRIHELLVISRELSIGSDKSLMKTSESRNCFSEANYIEFAGVRVRKSIILLHVDSIFFYIPCSNSSGIFQVVTPTGNVLVDDLTLRVDSGSNLLITGIIFRSEGMH